MPIHPFDIDALAAIRANVQAFIEQAGQDYDRKTLKVLEIGPTDQLPTAQYFPQSMIETLDIAEGCTYKADICRDNRNFLYSNSFGMVICTEVLEHTKDPFAAMREIFRILKPGGILLASSPLNFRIHGPLPDCWRFTEHGWRALLADFEDIEIKELASDRWLFPIHYTVKAKKIQW